MLNVKYSGSLAAALSYCDPFFLLMDWGVEVNKLMPLAFNIEWRCSNGIEDVCYADFD